MNLKDISPDAVSFLQLGPFSINATIVFTWLIMAILTLVSWLATRNLSTGPKISRWQNLLEVIVRGTQKQIREVSQQEPSRYLPFVGTLFMFIAMSNVLTIIPGYIPPTARAGTTSNRPSRTISASRRVTIHGSGPTRSTGCTSWCDKRRRAGHITLPPWQTTGTTSPSNTARARRLCWGRHEPTIRRSLR